ncbi:probable endochitinase [Argonauta hians]
MSSVTDNILVLLVILQCTLLQPVSTSPRGPNHVLNRGPNPNRGPSCTGLKDGFYPDKLDCRVFYRCVGNIPYQFACPPGIYFDARINVCNWPHEVHDCDADGKRTRVHYQQKQQQQQRQMTERGNYLRAHYNNNNNNNNGGGGGDYDYYYDGGGGGGGGGGSWTIYGQDDRDFPDSRFNGGGGGHQSGSGPGWDQGRGPQPGLEPKTHSFNCPQPNGFYPDSADCRLFYRCVAGRSYQFKCARGTLYDRAISVCNYPDRLPECDSNGRRRFGNVGNLQRKKHFGTGPDSLGKKPPAEFFDCPQKYHLFPHPKSCTKFYYCNGQRGLLFECPEGLTFNYEQQICDFNKNFKC